MGAGIRIQCICIAPCGTYVDESDICYRHAWNVDNESSSTANYNCYAKQTLTKAGQSMSQFISMPGEAVIVSREVVKTMITKGFV